VITIPPHSPANEAGLIGAVIMDNEQLTRLTIQPEDFYIERNRVTWEAILTMRREGKAVDTITLATELNNRGQLGNVGGMAGIMRYSTACVSSQNAPSYQAEIAEDARRRLAIEALQRCAGAMFDRSQEMSPWIAECVDRLAKATQKINGADHLKVFLSRVWDELVEAMANPKDIFGIATGLPGFDAITHGLQQGETFKLSGDPGVGKSLLAMQLACGMAKSAPGAVFELEMTAAAVVRRRLSAIAEIPTYKMRSGSVKEDEFQSIVGAMAEMEKLDIYLSDSSSWTTMELRMELQRLKATHNIQWFMLDYEGLLKDELRGENEIGRGKIISSRMHDMTKDLNLAALIVDVKNKAGMGQAETGQQHLAGSSGKAYDADQIAFLEFKDATARTYRLKWHKIREGGETNRILELMLTTGFPAFRELERRM
jgi:replicative DNA helicase